jgi:hypothetical protein
MAHIRREAKVNIEDGHRAAALFKSLFVRKAIPEVRLRYFVAQHVAAAVRNSLKAMKKV